jgi:hypothetical protein
MKGFIQIALTATLVAGVTAQPHVHLHRHHHAKKYEHAVVEKRDSVTVTSVVAATVTEYVLDGEKVDIQKAQDGIEGGDFVVVGSSTPTFTPPPPPPSSTSSTVSSSSTTVAAQFFEHKSSTSSIPAPVETPTSSAKPAETPVATGIDAPFPTGDDAPPCSEFPSAWGAIPIKWLGTEGWTSLQQPSNGYIPGVKINTIVAPTTGGCRENMFCSYACPPGYQKSQFPQDSQGATGQSVGGLWCDATGKLRLTRPSHKTLCQKGAGGVVIKNSLSGTAAVCGTDYPASENMVVPLETTPGGTFELTNTDSSDYYVWNNQPTTAQYYVNNLDVPLEEACTWKSAMFPDSAGNWAPINIGVGKATTGITFLSIFPNLPTSTAKLNFNIRITGDVNMECKLENGVYSNGNSAGCTVSLIDPTLNLCSLLTRGQTAISKPGGTAVIEFYH